MLIEALRDLPGPNPYAKRPVLILAVRLSPAEEHLGPGSGPLAERLQRLVPGLARSTCRSHRRTAAGCLQRGTTAAHLAEHAVLALCRMVGQPVHSASTRPGGPPGSYLIVASYTTPAVLWYLLPASVDLVSAAVEGRTFDLAGCLAEAQRLVAQNKLEPHIQAILAAARRRSIPARRLPGADRLQLGYGQHSHFITVENRTVDNRAPAVLPGAQRRAAQQLVATLFPPGQASRIPIVSVTGTNGKTTTARLLAHLLGAGAAEGPPLGLATSEGVEVNGRTIIDGRMANRLGASAVLSDTRVGLAVLETACRSIRQHGLGYDLADVAVLTNIQADHLGQDGLDSLDDVAQTKGLVATHVAPGGTLVLNADDPRTAALARRAPWASDRRRVLLFGLWASNPLVQAHVARGGTALVQQAGWLTRLSGDGPAQLLLADALPVAAGGLMRFNVANALAAAAAAHVLGLSDAAVAQGLAGFRAPQHNPGRACLYQVGRGFVLVDGARNAPALAAIGQVTAQWAEQGWRTTGVINAPASRPDPLLEAFGQAASQVCHRLIVTEEAPTAARPRGTVAGLVAHGIRTTVPDREMSVVLDEAEAIATALSQMQAGELVLIATANWQAALAQLEAHGALPGLPEPAFLPGSERQAHWSQPRGREPAPHADSTTAR